MRRSLASDVRGVARAIGRFFAGAPGWFAGALIGIQAAVLGFGAVWIIAVAIMMLSDTEGLPGTWSATTDVAMNVWLLGHGVPLTTAQATFTLVPWGLTAAFALIAATVAWRFSEKSWGCWLVATGVYAAAVAGATVMRWHEIAGLSAVVWRGAGIAAVIIGTAVAVGIWRAHGAEFGWVHRVPRPIRHGLRLGLGSLALIVALAAALGVVIAYRTRHAAADVASSLGFDGIAGVAIAVVETAYVPVIVIWLVAWISGTGFDLGYTTTFLPGVTTADQVPALPLLTMLPDADGPGWAWVSLTMLVVGALAWNAQRARQWSPPEALATGVVATFTVWAASFTMFAMSTGAIGPGSLQSVGPPPLRAATLVMCGIAAGYALAALARGALQWGTGHLRRTPPRTAPTAA